VVDEPRLTLRLEDEGFLPPGWAAPPKPPVRVVLDARGRLARSFQQLSRKGRPSPPRAFSEPSRRRGGPSSTRRPHRRSSSPPPPLRPRRASRRTRGRAEVEPRSTEVRRSRAGPMRASTCAWSAPGGAGASASRRCCSSSGRGARCSWRRVQRARELPRTCQEPSDRSAAADGRGRRRRHRRLSGRGHREAG